MADERRLGGWVARHAAYSVVLAIVFGVTAASFVAYLWLARTTASGLQPVNQQIGHLAFADGAVRVKRLDSNEFVTADEGVALGPLDTIQTSDNAVALIRFGDGTSYRMDPGMTIVLRDTAGPFGSRADVAELSTGQVSPVQTAATSPLVLPADVITSNGEASSVRRRIDLVTSPSAPQGAHPHGK